VLRGFRYGVMVKHARRVTGACAYVSERTCVPTGSQRGMGGESERGRLGAGL
jgi:hypothetical protein